MTDLLFSQIPASNADLVFGAAEDLPNYFPFDLAGALPGLVFTARVAPVTRLSIVGAFANDLTAVMIVDYSTNTQRPVVSQAQAFAQNATSIESGLTQPQQHALTITTGVTDRAQEAVYAHAGVTPTFANALRTDATTAGVFQEGQRAPAPHLSGRFQDGQRDTGPRIQSRFQDGQHASARLWGRFQDCLHDRRPVINSRWKDANPLHKGLSDRAGYASPLHVYRATPFQEARRPPAGISTRPITPPVVPPYWGSDLVFACPPLFAPNLVFGLVCTPTTPSALLQILPARFYMTTHNVFAQRLPDLSEIPIYDPTVSADAGSYCWTLQASGPASLFELLAPVGGLPVQLRVTMDGIPFVFAIDALQRTHSFGKTGVSITGRSVTALIGAPYLRATVRDNAGGGMLAQQLALSALQYTGVDLDWGLTDWMVSAGAWSHSGTPLDAVQAIAQAAGGYLQSHRSAPMLLTRHPYSQRAGDNPGAPWGWMTGPADVELAPDAIITDSIERKDGSDLNAVYVSGTTQGVLAQVKRTGTAGDKLGAMVTDALITDAIAARQRGLAVLGAAGSKYNVRLELPVLTGLNQPGVLDVGQLVQVNAANPWRGRVQSVSVSAKRPSIRQTVTLERHLETV